jgi:hypothetical protein
MALFLRREPTNSLWVLLALLTKDNHGRRDSTNFRRSHETA